ncbi:hemicentin-1 [Fundulus heteroclitus]|uniref:hemicentin-1 n=1 Tax=Fundulus heteroclitus TaxID=8078 RepID=UPI00165AF8E3|nr:hemicentin-1 [Fundulus heteroclitus]
MFVFIWLIVSLPTNNDASGWGREHCQTNSYCVTLNENIRAEAGLCAVIPCSFKSGFEAEVIIWYKCDQLMDRCGDFDKVFHSDKNIENVQSGFKGRVSLLEPDVTQKNCSIMINDLRPSDSGYYQLRVEGEGTGNAWTYTTKTFLSLTDVNTKSKMKIPLLTEGQQATLTCTAPGLCSGSPPKITWMWRRKGEKDFHITGNTTSLKTENLTTLTQRHSSTLTFNPSAEHHNSKITCKVSFTGDQTKEETATLNVTYKRKPQIFGNVTVKEGDVLNLTCSVDSFPPSVINWTKIENGTLPKNVSFPIINVTVEDAGRYVCTATYRNSILEEEINVRVTYLRRLQISGKTRVKEGDSLNLTCSADSFPPSVIQWTKFETKTNLQRSISSDSYNSNEDILKGNHGNGSFSITNVTAEDAGLYICTVKHLIKDLKKTIKVTVTYKRKPQIFGNVTVKEGDVLNLTCSVNSFPPSVINWTKNENGTLQKNVSFPIINVTVEDAGRYVCTATYLNSILEEEINVRVTYTRKPQVYGRTTVMEGDDVNLACSVDSFPPSVIKWTQPGTETGLNDNILRKADNSRVTYLQEKSGNASFSIINITAEEAGRYICTATNQNGNMTEEVHVKVNYLRRLQISGKTRVKEGDSLNLTCSADSFPPSVIQWTKFETKTNLQRSISSDSYNSNEDILKGNHGNGSFSITNVTAEDAGLYICTVKHLIKDLKKTIKVTVTYQRKPQIFGNATVKEGDVLNLTCSVDSFPPSVINWTKYEKGTLPMNVSFPIINVTVEDAGRYICTATYLNSILEEEIHVRVTYQRRPQVDGNPTVKEGDVLNLTCSVDSFPPSFIKWTKHSPILNPKNRTILSNSAGSANLVIVNMTVEDSARYICTATYMNKTVAEYVDIEVTWFPKILKGSGCLLRSDVLTCVCISEGFPLPTIKWPLLEDHTEYPVTTMVSDHIVNSTLTVRNHGNISVECTSSNENGEVKQNLIVHQDLSEGVNHVKDCGSGCGALPWVIAGVSLSVNVFCMICMWHLWNTRKKMKPTEVDQTYMSLQKADTSPEYDVIYRRSR